MAGFSLPGQVPYAPVAGPSDFAVASNAAVRKRKLAEMLQQQALGDTNTIGLNVPGARMSLVNPLAALLQGFASKKLNEDSDTAEAAANKAAQEGLDEAIKNMPRPTEAVPAQPIAQEQVGAPPGAVPPPAPLPSAAAFGPGGMPPNGPAGNDLTGSGSAMAAQLLGGAPPEANPLAPPGGAPEGPPLLPQKTDMSFPGMVPKLTTDAIAGKNVDPYDMFKFAAGLNKFGPQGAEIGKELRAGAAKEMTMLPKSDIDPYTVAGSSVFNKKTGKWMDASPETKARMEETRAKNIEDNATKNRALDIKESLGEDRNALLQLTKAIASGGAGGAARTVGRATDDAGGFVVEKKDGSHEVIRPDGKREVYNGDYQPIAAYEREVTNVTKAREHLGAVNGLVTDIEKNPDAYGTAAAVGSGIPVLGKWIADASLTPEQRQVRAGVQTQMSALTKQIFGSAFTSSEQVRAEPWIVQPGDPFDVALDKVKKMQAYAQETLRNKSTAATKTSEARNPTLPKTPSAGGSDIDALVNKHAPK